MSGRAAGGNEPASGPPPAAGIRIEARGLGRRAGRVSLLSGVTFTAHPGELLVLLGPSGAGKSTLLYCLNGYTSPDEGRVLYDGEDLHARPDLFRGRIGFVPQDDVVHGALTAERSLHYALRLRCPATAPEEVDRRVEEVLERVDLTARRGLRVGRLSGGQRKRVSVGVELVARPPVLMADEPTSGLDPALEERMMALFASIAREGRTVVVTTHVLDSLRLADEVAVLYSGRLVYFGPPADAPGYFGADEPAAIYRRLADRSPTEWQVAFEATPLAARARERPVGAVQGADALRPPAGAERTIDEMMRTLAREVDSDGA